MEAENSRTAPAIVSLFVRSVFRAISSFGYCNDNNILLEMGKTIVCGRYFEKCQRHYMVAKSQNEKKQNEKGGTYELPSKHRKRLRESGSGQSTSSVHIGITDASQIKTDTR